MELWLIWVEDEESGERDIYGAFEDEAVAREVYEVMLEEWGEGVHLSHMVATNEPLGGKRGRIGRFLGKIRGQSPESAFTPEQIHHLDQLRMELRGQKLAGRVIGTPISHE